MKPTSSTFVHSIARLATATDAGVVFTHTENGDRSLSYAELYQRAKAEGLALLGEGLQSGDRIVLVTHEPEEFVPSFLGAMLVEQSRLQSGPPLGVRSTEIWAQGLERILARSGARAIHASAGLIDDVAPIATRKNIPLRAIGWAADSNPTGRLPPLDSIRPQDIAFLQFTSGSTGEPRGVRVTHAALCANCDGIMQSGLRYRSGEVAVSWLPLFHDMGLIGFLLSTVRYLVPTIYIFPQFRS